MTRLAGDLRGFFHLPINTEREDPRAWRQEAASAEHDDMSHVHKHDPATEQGQSRLIKMVE